MLLGFSPSVMVDDGFSAFVGEGMEVLTSRALRGDVWGDIVGGWMVLDGVVVSSDGADG